MLKSVNFALAVVLACFVAVVASQPGATQVSDAQRAILTEIASEWPALATWHTKPWTSENIDKACIGGLSFVDKCNGTGWILEASFVPIQLEPWGIVPVPRALSKMQGLETLRLGGFFNGSLDVELGNLTSLKTLGIYDSVFTTPFPLSWSGMHNLVEFVWQFALNQEAQPFPEFLRDKEALSILLFFQVNITGPIPDFVGSLPSLSTFSMITIPLLTGPIPETFANHSKLQSLHLNYLPSFNQGSSSSLPSDWSRANRLHSISILETPITGSLPTKMHTFFLQFSAVNTLLSGTIPQTLIDSSGLTSLNLEQSPIIGAIPAPTNRALSKLEYLRVRDTNVDELNEDILR